MAAGVRGDDVDDVGDVGTGFGVRGGQPTLTSGDDDPDRATTVGAGSGSQPAAPRIELGPGDTIDRYVVERQLGVGGMGVVYAARDRELGRVVAIKVVRPQFDDDAYRARLVREARAMAQLSHPSVVPVYDVGTRGAEVFVAMELIDGHTLASWLRTARPWREVLARFVAAGRGLAAAHQAGLVHRDFKPDNVLLGRDGRVCVVDFGLALPAGDDDRGPSSLNALADDDDGALTATGLAVGTPAYMAPEQHRGRGVDARADQFSFAVALHEGLYGQRPFVAEKRPGVPFAVTLAEAAGAGKVVAAPKGSKVPAWLRRAVLRGLAVNPAARWPSMAALLDELEAVPRRRRRGAIAATAVAGFGGVVTAAILVTAHASRPSIDCTTEPTAIDAAWNPARRDAVRAALVGTGVPWATTAADRAIERLDRFATGWTDLRVSSCRDARRGVLEPERWLARVACLDGRREELRARVDILAAVDRDGARRAGELVDLADVAPCAWAGAHGPELPEGDSARARIVELQRRDAEADALRAAGRYGEARTRARAVLADAEAAGWPPLLDTVRLTVADIDLTMGLHAEAEQLARATAESATGRGDDLAAARAWQFVVDAKTIGRDADGLAEIAAAARGAARRAGQMRQQIATMVVVGEYLAVVGRRYDEGRAACEEAEALVARHLAGDDDRQAGPALCLATIHEQQGKFAEALRYAERVSAIRSRTLGVDHPLYADAIRNQAITLNRLGRRAESLALRRQAHEVIVRAWGEDSDETAASLRGLALSLVGGDAADHEQARTNVARAVEIVEARHGAASVEAAEMRSALAYVLSELGDHAGAAAEYARVLPVLEADDPSALMVIMTATNYAEELRMTERCAEALPMLERVLAGNTRSPEMDIRPRFQLAACRLELGRAADAVAALGPTLAALDRQQLPALELAHIDMLFGLALVDAGQDPARARAVLESARATLLDAGAGDDVAAIDVELRRLR